MIKPTGYDETQAFTGESMTLPPGGYVCKIIAAKEEKSKRGASMLVIAFDICEGQYDDFYGSKHAAVIERNPAAKWPGVFYQLTEGASLPYFKGMITAIEESNPGYKWNWDEKTLTGKKFGGVFGREEFETQDGRLLMVTKLFYIRSVEAVRKGVEAPADKLLEGKNRPAARSGSGKVTGDDVYNQIHEDDVLF